jgi:hypothetical protein
MVIVSFMVIEKLKITWKTMQSQLLESERVKEKICNQSDMELLISLYYIKPLTER